MSKTMTKGEFIAMATGDKVIVSKHLAAGTIIVSLDVWQKIQALPEKEESK